MDIDIVNSHAFVAHSEHGLCVIDFENPNHPLLIATTAPNVRSVKAVGHTIYAASDTSGWQIIDVFDPLTPRVVTTVPVIGITQDLDYANDCVFIANDELGLQIFDVADPTQPAPMGRIALTGEPLQVVVSGNYAFVVIDRDVIQVIDVSDPAFPQLAATIDPAGDVYDLQVSGFYLYTACNYDGLRTYDISNPNSPLLVTNLVVPGQVRGIAARDDRLYLGGSGLFVVDNSDATRPTVLARLNVRSLAGHLEVQKDCAVAMEGDWSSFFGVEIFDVSSRADRPRISRTCDNIRLFSPVAVHGDRAFFAKNHTLWELDLANPLSCSIVDSVALPGGGGSIAVDDEHAYVSVRIGKTMHLEIFDISRPRNMVSVGSVRGSTTYDDYMLFSTGLAVKDNIAYWAVAGEGFYDIVGDFYIFDCSEPSAPKRLSHSLIPSQVSSVLVREHLAYILSPNLGLLVYDVSDPVSPVRLGRLDAFEAANSMAIWDQYALVADGYEGLQIVDISNPYAPAIIANIAIRERAWDVAVCGRYAYVTDDYHGLKVVDLKNFAAPVLIGEIATPREARGVSIYKHMVLVSDYYAGLHFIPQQCAEETSVSITGFDCQVTAAGVVITWGIDEGGASCEFRVIADGGGRRWEVPLRAVGQQAFTAEDHIHFGLTADAITYSLLMRTTGEDWRTVASKTVTTHNRIRFTRFESAYPNPMNPRITCTFTLNRPAQAEIAVYTLTGRRIAVLADKIFHAGRHQIQWDGRDARGQTVASGTYFLRLASDTATDTRKISLVR